MEVRYSPVRGGDNSPTTIDVQSRRRDAAGRWVLVYSTVPVQRMDRAVEPAAAARILEQLCSYRTYRSSAGFRAVRSCTHTHTRADAKADNTANGSRRLQSSNFVRSRSSLKIKVSWAFNAALLLAPVRTLMVNARATVSYSTHSECVRVGGWCSLRCQPDDEAGTPSPVQGASQQTLSAKGCRFLH